MKFTIQSLEEKNITFVYKTLDISSVSLDRLNRLGAKHESNTQLHQLPGALVVALLDIQTVLRLGEHRLRIDDQSQATVEGTHLPQLAIDATKAIQAQKLEQLAYGFNFRFTISLSNNQNAGDFFRDRFLKDGESWNTKTHSELIGFEPRFFFTKEKTRYDLRLVLPSQDQKPQDVAHVLVNVHYATDIQPTQSKLKKRLHNEFVFLQQVIEKI